MGLKICLSGAIVAGFFAFMAWIVFDLEHIPPIIDISFLVGIVAIFSGLVMMVWGY